MKLVFKELEVNNFLSISKLSINLDNQQMVLIEGINYDSTPIGSNGSGKSSIFDAILWVLFGTTLRGTTNIGNNLINKDTICRLKFTLDDDEYTVERIHKNIEKNNNLLIYKDDKIVYNSLKKSQDYLNNLLTISSANILGSIILLGQGLPYKFSSLSQSARKETLESLTRSSDVIDNIQEKLNSKKSLSVQEISDLNNEKWKLTGQTESYKTLLESFKSDVNVEDLIAQINNLESSNLESNQTIEKLKTHISSITNQITHYTNLKQSKEKIYYGLLSEKNSAVNQLSSLSTRCPTCGREYDNEEEIINLQKDLKNKIEQKDSEIQSIADKLSQINDLIAPLETQIQDSNNQIFNLNNDIVKNNFEIKKLKSDIESAQNQSDKISEINQSIINNTITLNSLDKELQSKEYYLAHIDWLLRELSREFRGYVLDDSIELLCNRTNYYSKYLTNKPIRIYRNKNAVVIELNNIPYENLSGGERQRVDISVQFALRDILRLTTGFECNILVLDEIFDGLDFQGCQQLIDLISNEFTEMSSIYIVTHHADFDMPYDKKVTVVKKEGLSTIL